MAPGRPRGAAAIERRIAAATAGGKVADPYELHQLYKSLFFKRCRAADGRGAADALRAGVSCGNS